jgi:DNA processing protein
LYPKLLKHIYDPPIVLYVRGSLTKNDGAGGVAVVGSRQTTHYGRETARRLSRDLARSGVTVVSGGARGIDTAAHHGALEGGGRTIAVLGTGINHVYPAENAQLFERIASNGALITQFPFNRPGDRQSFPIRNRIVAGMTLGCVVVEAALTSGALITCNMALDNGRSVFSVPGRIDSPRSKGCHELIKRGSKLCENVEDILCEFEYLFPPSNHPVSALSQTSSTTATPATQRSHAESRPHSKLPSQSNLKTSEKLQRRAPLVKLDITQLEGAEQKILSLLSEQDDLDLDEIIRAGGLTSAEVATGLLKLEMKKAVVRLPGRRFAALS